MRPGFLRNQKIVQQGFLFKRQTHLEPGFSRVNPRSLPIPCLFLFIQSSQILFPFRGEEIFFLGVAFLAGRDHVARDRSPAACYRNEMVHGELISLELLAAIIADSGRTLSLPPLRVPELPGLRFLPLDMLFVGCNEMI
jgi:hypothetical protein